MLPSLKAILHLSEHLQTASDNDIPGREDPTEVHWEDTIQEGEAFKEHGDEVMNLLGEYQAMWSGLLGNIPATKHRMSLLNGSKPVYQPAYRAGPRTRDLEEDV